MKYTHELGEVKEIIVSDGYSHGPEVEKILAAILAFGGPGQVLWGATESAKDVWRKLDHAGKTKAADDLAALLEIVMPDWKALMVSYLRK